MRVLCLLWVLMLGVCQFTMSSAVFNPWTLQHYFQTYGYTAVYSSNLGFDEFFFLSSFLLTVKIDSINRKTGLPLTIKRYAKLFGMRFLRLAPIYYLIFLVGWQVGPYFGSGPCWFTYEKGFSNCNDYWWSVFTMTINFFPSYVIANEGCYYWGWYPACDLQIFILLPLLIYYTLKVRSAARRTAIVLLGTFVGIVINAYVIWKNNMAAGLFAPQDVLIFKIFVNKPYTKLHAIFLGLGMGLLFLSIQKSKLQGN